MPPKAKISKEDIISAALSLLRTEGKNVLNARRIASALGCSTQPIFSNFETMEALHNEVLSEAYQRYTMFLEREASNGIYPKYKSFGMAYIRFAKEEPELFRFLFMRDRKAENLDSTADFETSIQLIMEANDVSYETASLMHLEIWTFVHGIATMIVTSFLTFEWDLISTMTTDIYQGVCARHLSKGNRT